MSETSPQSNNKPVSEPDMLRQAGAVPSTSTRGIRALRSRLNRRRQRHAPQLMAKTISPAINTTICGNCPNATKKIGPETITRIVDAAFVPAELLEEQPEDEIDYDSLSPYFVEAAEQRRLVEKEVRRLADAANNPDKPLLIQGGERLGKGDSVGYEALSTLTRCVADVTLICECDNDGISLVHAPMGLTASKFCENIRTLRGRCTQDEMASRLGLSRDPNGHDRVWKNSQELAEDAASLLDLVTACFAQYLSQVTEGGFRWRDDQLAVLAKFTAKAKYLLQNVSDNASIAVRNAEISLATFEATYGPPVDDKNEFENCDNNDERERIEIERRFKNSLNNHKFSASESGTLETIYYRLLQQLVRKHLMDSIKSVLGSLLPAIRGPGFGLTEYEVCGVVTDSAGIHGFNMFIFQDRDFEYTSTSNPDQINFAHPAFRMLDVLVAHLAQAHKMRPPSGSPQAIGSSATKTILEWEYTALDMPMEPRLESGRTLTTPASTPTVKRYYLEATKTNRVRLELRDMREIITAMVQLGIVNPGVAGRFLVHFDTVNTEFQEPVRPAPERQYTAFVRLATNDFEEARQRRLPSDVLRLADAVSTGLFSRTSLLDSRVGSSKKPKRIWRVSTTAEKSEKRREKRARKLADAHELMNTWVYTENAVMVQCGRYVWLTIIGVSLLVLGGLAIGLTVQDRIVGVDPFNITMFLWTVAALVLLICKARRVEEWSWNDFLHQRVKCRSVSELHAVTNIDEQLILAKLLHDEKDSILRTRGPFNAVFRNKSENGFSIDVPLTNKTMLLSGLIMIKVDAPLGHALICLDVRRGTGQRIVEHRGILGTKGTKLFCNQIERLAQASSSRTHNDGAGPQLRFPLKEGSLEWRSVEGVYKVLDAEFT